MTLVASLHEVTWDALLGAAPAAPREALRALAELVRPGAAPAAPLEAPTHLAVVRPGKGKHA